MRKLARTLGAVLLAGVLLVPAASAQTAGLTGSAEIINANGQPVGTATLSEDAGGAVTVQVQVQGLANMEGLHGAHIHGVGKCETDQNFSTAGPHFNPTGSQHGMRNPQGPHAGDLPNVALDANGMGTLTYPNGAITLTDGPNSIFDADGSAIVIHAGEDDEVSDPAGNSGARVACGTITRMVVGDTTVGMPRTGSGDSEAGWLLGSIAAVLAALGALLRSRTTKRAEAKVYVRRDDR